MFPEWLSALPSWLVTGVLLGGVLSVGVALLFAVGQRFVPASGHSGGRRIDGSARRRREIREYLRRIGERYAEDVELLDHRVAFYLPEREVAVTFDVQTYFRLTNADPDAVGSVGYDPDYDPDGLFVVLMIHEMPGHHLGRLLPFEVDDDHLHREETADPVAEAFATLDLPTTADEDEVESAYRERVKEVHPDQGGDREAFTAVREAYATASNYASDGS